jgi:hypothetical protein
MDFLAVYTEVLRLETRPTFCSHVAVHSYTYEELRQFAGIRKHMNESVGFHGSVPGFELCREIAFFAY